MLDTVTIMGKESDTVLIVISDMIFFLHPVEGQKMCNCLGIILESAIPRDISNQIYTSETGVIVGIRVFAASPEVH